MAVLNLVKQKIIAHYTGVAGLGVLGLANSYLFLLYAVGSLTLFSAVTKYLSEFEANHETDNISALWSSAWLVSFGFSILTGVVIIVTGYDLGTPYLSHGYFALITCSLPFYVIGNLMIAVYKGYQEFKKLAVIQLVAALVTVIVTYYLVSHKQIGGLVISLWATMFVLAVVTFLGVFTGKTKQLMMSKFRWDYRVLQLILRFSGVVLLTNLMIFGVQFMIRKEVVNILGLEGNGFIQAALYFSMFFLIIQETFFTYLFPRLSEAQDNLTTNMELERSFRLSGAVNIAFSVGIIILIRPVLSLLLTRDFWVIDEFISFIFLGEIFRVWTWVMGSVFLSRSKLKTNFWITVVYVLLYAAGLYSGMKYGGITGFAIGYALIHIVLFILNWFCIQRLTGLRIQIKSLGLIGTAIILVGYASYLKTGIFMIDLLSGILIPVVVLWGVLTAAERKLIVEKITAFFKSTATGELK